MKYAPPFDATDPNASYVNGNPSTGVLGSIPPAPAFEEAQREILAVITAAGLTPTHADLTQLLQALGVLYAPAKARYWHLWGASGTIPSAVDTRMVNYSTELSNMPGSTINKTAGTVTIGAADAGIYLLAAAGAVVSQTSIDIVSVRINGGSWIYQAMQSPSDVAQQDPSCAGLYRLVAGDVVDATYYQYRSAGGSNTLVSGVPIFAGARLGGL